MTPHQVELIKTYMHAARGEHGKWISGRTLNERFGSSDRLKNNSVGTSSSRWYYTLICLVLISFLALQLKCGTHCPHVHFFYLVQPDLLKLKFRWEIVNTLSEFNLHKKKWFNNPTISTKYPLRKKIRSLNCSSKKNLLLIQNKLGLEKHDRSF